MRKLLSVTLLAAMALYAQKGRPQRVVTFTAGGTGDAITGTPDPALAAYTDMSGAAPPLQACFIATAANTGATTINLNSLGAKSLFKFSGAINTALVANDIRVGQRVCFVYYAAGDAFQMLTPVGNAASGGSALVCSLGADETISATGDFPTNSCSIASGLTAGKHIRIRASGVTTTPSDLSVFFRVRVGGTDSGYMVVSTNGTANRWYMDYDAEVVTAGASGTLDVFGKLGVETVADGFVAERLKRFSESINTTGAVTVRIAGAPSASGTITLTHLKVWVE